MAKSPAHKFGQIIGDLLEEATISYCMPIVQAHEMYLDYIHSRPARNNNRKVRWIDVNGNHHDFDLVIEEAGDENTQGIPRAFIEVAWRRYTKHSKNKAQEISAAVTPCAARYSRYAPFRGAVLAGEFTETSLEQLRSEGFVVLHFPYEAVLGAFAAMGIDASSDERTPDKEFQKKVEQFEGLSEKEVLKIKEKLFKSNKEDVDQFIQALDRSLERSIKTISITTLYGSEQIFSTVRQACDFMAAASSQAKSGEELVRFEIRIEYSNGDVIDLKFTDAHTAINYFVMLA